MAKKSMIVKNIRRKQIVERYRVRRIELKGILKSPKTSEEEVSKTRLTPEMTAARKTVSVPSMFTVKQLRRFVSARLTPSIAAK